ncbi:peptide-methionine (R)-S-oxide reductase MsrB [Pseudomonas sp. P7759]|uniref:peptide-methionine (R)-S-oxide reductase MsrB n=1 Tax=Pseudomonas sp. P7759 TaxID=2738831 RepID=UPI00159F9201|nr:peptide-methionine (R)-S-oxide reductase MsrB [Pseudomonas sp. P7759]NWC78587.1 peptide-methionine (R)-S-oxide reductase MsrB [Pseudomonas sp. P7759]
MYSRRQILLASGGIGVALVAGGLLKQLDLVTEAEAAETFEVTHTDAQWRSLLTAEQYEILREEGTERPYTSALNDEHRAGTFACAGCALPLFSSATKFNSHTGWPSFWQPLDNAVASRRDTSYGVVRKEIHCRRCGGHQGHVFDDGPQPTGLRYCMNGAAMTFTAA